MRLRQAQITTVFQSNTIFYLVPVLVFAYVFMQQRQILEWQVFLSFILDLLSITIPLLAWSWWADTRRPSRLGFWGLWVVAFTLYPAMLIFVLGLGEGDLPMVSNATAYQTPGGGVGLIFFFAAQFLLSLVLIASSHWRERPRVKPIADWNIQRLALGVLLVFAFLLVLVSNYFQEAVRDLSFAGQVLAYLWTVLQVFIIYGTYYFLYYVHHHGLFNRLLRRKGILHYGLGSVGFLLLFVPLQNAFIVLFPAVRAYKIHPLGVIPEVLNDMNFTLALIFFLLTLPFIIMIEWYRQQRAITVLEKEKSATELQLLKQQINPHFFFNTLNNLYAMSLTQEQETPEVILKLSELMRYVIYQGQKEEVTLQQELDYLQRYLDLQSLRLHQKLDLKFNVGIQNPELRVPPLLFVILLENAFKHGIEPAEQPTFLHLELKEEAGVVGFRCENAKVAKRETESAGIGLSNLKRRLAVRFPDRHELKLVDENERFLASLKLYL